MNGKRFLCVAVLLLVTASSLRSSEYDGNSRKRHDFLYDEFLDWAEYQPRGKRTQVDWINVEPEKANELIALDNAQERIKEEEERKRKRLMREAANPGWQDRERTYNEEADRMHRQDELLSQQEDREEVFSRIKASEEFSRALETEQHAVRRENDKAYLKTMEMMRFWREQSRLGRRAKKLPIAFNKQRKRKEEEKLDLAEEDQVWPALNANPGYFSNALDRR